MLENAGLIMKNKAIVTLEEVGNEPGIICERVRQIENKCIQKLEVRARKNNMVPID